MAIRHISKVYDYLQKNGKTAQARISRDLNINYYAILQILNFLKERDEVSSEEKGSFTYWELK